MIGFEDASIERIRVEFAGRFSGETIDEIFHASIAQLKQDARVDTFVPLLAERRTRERLTALEATTTHDGARLVAHSQ